MPQFLACARIERIEVSARGGRKNEITGSRQDSGPGRRSDAMLPLDFAGLRRHRDHLAPAFFGSETRSATSTAPEKRFARLELGCIGLEEPPAFLARVEIK